MFLKLYKNREMPGIPYKIVTNLKENNNFNNKRKDGDPLYLKYSDYIVIAYKGKEIIGWFLFNIKKK